MNKTDLFIYKYSLIKLKNKKKFYKLQLINCYFYSLFKIIIPSFYLFFIYLIFIFRIYSFLILIRYIWFFTGKFIVKNYFFLFFYSSFISSISSILKYSLFLLKRELFSIFLLSSRYTLQWVIKQINFCLYYWIKKWENIFFFDQSINLRLYENLERWLFEKQCRYINKYNIQRSLLWKIRYYFGPFDPYSQDFWRFGDCNSSTYLIKYKIIKV
uniref:Reverse trascriptase/intron maturase n=1 Tax=Gymnochlora stellata TaxID=67809 RepID=A0A140JZF1_GYMST|nr:reverse trascriptase/intron maturase [Gymnochlora stellata]BAU62478.1 reverse trascriptase/intron maturase [Gymnochlora stellata]